ncbi:MAG: hypothetical protein OEM41_05685 [Ignavibacteria bacterium]|nr:hypothetical protein [Ignavibacteria bacterium]
MYDTSGFFSSDRASDRFICAVENLLVDSPVFWIVLNGTDGHATETSAVELPLQ